jgi:hypothetical protein
MDTDSLSRELSNKRYIFSDLLKVETIQQLQFSLDFRYFFCDKQKFNYYLMSHQKKKQFSSNLSDGKNSNLVIFWQII